MPTTSSRARTKRRPNLPYAVFGFAEKVSKADLLEAAYYLASLCHDGSCDDEEATVERLKEELRINRENRSARPLKCLEVRK